MTGAPPPGERISVRRAGVDDWRELRDQRLEMLADTPIAFGDDLRSASGYGDEQWIARARRMTTSGSIVAVALSGDRFVGTMSSYYQPPGGRAYLVTVYVSPSARGRDAGAADALLDHIESWLVDETEAESVVLSVHEDNARAQAFYRRRGFSPTGRSQPYPLDRSRIELEFARTLRPAVG